MSNKTYQNRFFFLSNFMSSVNWEGNKLNIPQSTKLEGLDDDLFIEIDSLKNKVDALYDSLSPDSLKKDINLENDVSYNILGISITNGKINSLSPIKLQGKDEPNNYIEVCKLFSYDGVVNLNYFEIKFDISCGFPQLTNFYEVFDQFYIKNNKLSTYHKLTKSNIIRHELTDYTTYPNDVFLSRFETLTSEKIQLLPGDYSLYLVYKSDGNPGGDLQFADYRITNDKSMFSGDHKFIFNRNMKIY